MKKQPESSLIQLWLATAHMTAAVVASAIAVTHVAAVRYHLHRIELTGNPGELDDHERDDLSYEQAISQSKDVKR